MNSGSAETLAREEGLVLLSIEGNSTNRLKVVSSSAIAITLKSSRSSTSILYYNISKLYKRVER